MKKKKEDKPEQISPDDILKQITDLEKKCKEFEDLWKRALADLENYRKRFNRETERLKIAERREAAIILLEILDNLERARAAETNADSSISQGIQAIIDQAEISLTRLGIEKVVTRGEKFDPLIHAAIDIVPGEEDNVIQLEQRPGYKIGDFLLRPALVVVTKKMPPVPEQIEEGEELEN